MQTTNQTQGSQVLTQEEIEQYIEVIKQIRDMIRSSWETDYLKPLEGMLTKNKLLTDGDTTLLYDTNGNESSKLKTIRETLVQIEQKNMDDHTKQTLLQQINNTTTQLPQALLQKVNAIETTMQQIQTTGLSQSSEEFTKALANFNELYTLQVIKKPVEKTLDLNNIDERKIAEGNKQQTVDSLNLDAQQTKNRRYKTLEVIGKLGKMGGQEDLIRDIKQAYHKVKAAEEGHETKIEQEFTDAIKEFDKLYTKIQKDLNLEHAENMDSGIQVELEQEDGESIIKDIDVRVDKMMDQWDKQMDALRGTLTTMGLCNKDTLLWDLDNRSVTLELKKIRESLENNKTDQALNVLQLIKSIHGQIVVIDEQIVPAQKQVEQTYQNVKKFNAEQNNEDELTQANEEFTKALANVNTLCTALETEQRQTQQKLSLLNPAQDDQKPALKGNSKTQPLYNRLGDIEEEGITKPQLKNHQVNQNNGTQPAPLVVQTKPENVTEKIKEMLSPQDLASQLQVEELTSNLNLKSSYKLRQAPDVLSDLNNNEIVTLGQLGNIIMELEKKLQPLRDEPKKDGSQAVKDSDKLIVEITEENTKTLEGEQTPKKDGPQSVKDGESTNKDKTEALQTIQGSKRLNAGNLFVDLTNAGYILSPEVKNVIKIFTQNKKVLLQFYGTSDENALLYALCNNAKKQQLEDAIQQSTLLTKEDNQLEDATQQKLPAKEDDQLENAIQQKLPAKDKIKSQLDAYTKLKLQTIDFKTLNETQRFTISAGMPKTILGTKVDYTLWSYIASVWLYTKALFTLQNEPKRRRECVAYEAAIISLKAQGITPINLTTIKQTGVYQNIMKKPVHDFNTRTKAINVMKNVVIPSNPKIVIPSNPKTLDASQEMIQDAKDSNDLEIMQSFNKIDVPKAQQNFTNIIKTRNIAETNNTVQKIQKAFNDISKIQNHDYLCNNIETLYNEKDKEVLGVLGLDLSQTQLFKNVRDTFLETELNKEINHLKANSEEITTHIKEALKIKVSTNHEKMINIMRNSTNIELIPRALGDKGRFVGYQTNINSTKIQNIVNAFTQDNVIVATQEYPMGDSQESVILGGCILPRGKQSIKDVHNTKITKMTEGEEKEKSVAMQSELHSQQNADAELNMKNKGDQHNTGALQGAQGKPPLSAFGDNKVLTTLQGQQIIKEPNVAIKDGTGTHDDVKTKNAEHEVVNLHDVTDFGNNQEKPHEGDMLVDKSGDNKQHNSSEHDLNADAELNMQNNGDQHNTEVQQDAQGKPPLSAFGNNQEEPNESDMLVDKSGDNKQHNSSEHDLNADAELNMKNNGDQHNTGEKPNESEMLGGKDGGNGIGGGFIAQVESQRRDKSTEQPKGYSIA